VQKLQFFLLLIVFFSLGFTLGIVIPHNVNAFEIASSSGSDVKSDTEYKIEPIEKVSASGPPRMVDITSTDSKLIFKSSIPLACSVVYGITTEYGSIATDEDMSGGAHTDHHPLLTGLEPDTEYNFRVQGTSAEGIFYFSENMKFRTSRAEVKTEANFASMRTNARVITVSSNYGGVKNDDRWGANSAIDEKRSTAWSSNGDGDDAFIEVELSSSIKIYAIEVWTRSMSDGTAIIRSFTVTTDSGEKFGPFTLKDDKEAYRYTIDTVARTLRLDVVESTGGNTGLVEFGVYGQPVKN
jgi:hypothetical protein